LQAFKSTSPSEIKYTIFLSDFFRMQSLPAEIENYIYNLSGLYKDIFKSVLQEIRMKRILRGIKSATHCHSCGKHSHVGFHGYVHQHCSKSCWKGSPENYYWYEEDFDDTYPLTKSTYHWYYLYYSKNGTVWPMKHCNQACTNECIQTRQTVRIPGYNVHDTED
jgi:hypothetical protein